MPREKTLLAHLDPDWQRAVENVRQPPAVYRPPSSIATSWFYNQVSVAHKTQVIVLGADDATKPLVLEPMPARG